MSQSDLSPAERYMIELNNQEPGYYAQIPGVIYHCTYVDTQMRPNKKWHGQRVRQKLSPIALTLYAVMRQLAGQKNKCWANRDTLAELVGCSVGAITNAKLELQQPMEQLGGKPLIEVKKANRRHRHGSGGTEYDLIQIVHIWGENNAYMHTLSHHPKLLLGPVHNSGSPSQGDSEVVSPSQGDSAVARAMSQGDTNNNHSNSQEANVITNKTQPRGGESCQSYLEREPAVSVTGKENMDLTWTMLYAAGADQKLALEMLSRFDAQRIQNACHYAAMQATRKKIKKPGAYLRTAIEKGFAWKD